MALTSIEVCAGAGGQAIGLTRAGFRHVVLIENDLHACATLRLNRPRWNIVQQDLAVFSADGYRDIDLLAGGLPCPPFSIAGDKRGQDDSRNLFPEMLRLAKELKPRAVMIENVRGLLFAVFDDYRRSIDSAFETLGYTAVWSLLKASDFGVPQLRPRAVCVALRPEDASAFEWPVPHRKPAPTVGAALYPLMAANSWPGAREWAARADRIGPTLVGGSRKHGGPDLGPTRVKRKWAEMGVDGMGLADEPPGLHFSGVPRLTVEMAAILQGFPPDWQFAGGKTAAYRQIGNAFPPPVAAAVGRAIGRAFDRVAPG